MKTYEAMNQVKTTSQALAMMNRAITRFTPASTKSIRKLRSHLTRRWLRDGKTIVYGPDRVANPVTQGIIVSRNMLLTDNPHLFDAIAAGAVPGYIPATKEHPADQWVIQVGSVWSATPYADIARELFEFETQQQRAQRTEVVQHAN